MSPHSACARSRKTPSRSLSAVRDGDESEEQDAVHHRRIPRHWPRDRAARGAGRRQCRCRRENNRAASEASGHHIYGSRGDRASGRTALPIALDIRDDSAVHAAAKQAADTFRRHRHSRQQRQRHQPHWDTGDADEALRPHVRRQRARHLLLLAGLPPLSEKRVEPAHPDACAAAQHEAEVVQGSRGVHDGEIRNEHVRARHGGGVSRPTASPSTRSGRGRSWPPPRCS